MASWASTSASTSDGIGVGPGRGHLVGLDPGPLERDAVEALGQPANGLVAAGAHLGQQARTAATGSSVARSGRGRWAASSASGTPRRSRRFSTRRVTRAAAEEAVTADRGAGLGTVWGARPGGEVMAATVVADTDGPCHEFPGPV